MISPRRPTFTLSVIIIFSITAYYFFTGTSFSLPHDVPSPKKLQASSAPDLQSQSQSPAPPIDPPPAIDPFTLPRPAGSPKPYSSPYTRTLVIPCKKSEDISWIGSELPSLPLAVYTVDDPNSPLRTPKNKGREAMVYLTYIIDHYANLSDTTIFMHAHRHAWHNNVLLGIDAAQTIRRLSDDRVARVGYMNTRCHHDPGCPDWVHLDRPEIDFDEDKKGMEKDFTVSVWRELFPHAPRIPPALSQPCCAQFAVSKDTILSVPRDEYIRLRKWLLNTRIPDDNAGRIFEYVWQYIFTGNAEFCPRPSSCYCDGYGICFGGARGLQDWLAKLKERERAEERLQGFAEARKGAGGKDGEGKKVLEEQEGKNEEWWKERLRTLARELDEEKNAAVERGNDPLNRALEAGRRVLGGRSL
ncbi:hypothetical protein MMC09_000917 [Bachmanniomyces sp. S44760]|nr:hypothetical protein [Bachmanniomyces sp. S44760]